MSSEKLTSSETWVQSNQVSQYTSARRYVGFSWRISADATSALRFISCVITCLYMTEGCGRGELEDSQQNVRAQEYGKGVEGD